MCSYDGAEFITYTEEDGLAGNDVCTMLEDRAGHLRNKDWPARGGGPAQALLLDESGVAKQGTGSVGVARQYCGALGKVDNCQVGVYLAYGTDREATLIDRRLYLPQSWVEDAARCAQAGIPPQAQVFRTKAELGLEMIQAAQAQGLPFAFVGMDAHYGETPWLLSRLDDEGITYSSMK